MTNQVMPKWKIDTIEAAIQALQRDKVPITASRSASAQDLRYLLMRSGSTLRLKIHGSPQMIRSRPFGNAAGSAARIAPSRRTGSP